MWLSEDALFTPRCCYSWWYPYLLALVCLIAGTPSHGFARILPWEFSAHSEQEDGVFITMTLSKKVHKLKSIGLMKFTVIARFKLGDTCEIELES